MRAFLWGRKMPLPNILEFIGTNVTQAGFKAAQEKLLNFLSGEAATKVELSAAVTPKANKADVDAALAAYVGGRKAYTTLALAQADQVNLPANTAIEVTNDGANNGTYQWNGTTLIKSAYDPLTQAKEYTDDSINVVTVSTNKKLIKYLEKTKLSEVGVSTSETVFPIAIDRSNKVLLGYNKGRDAIYGVGLVNNTDLKNTGIYSGSNAVIPIVTDKDNKVVFGYDQANDKLIGVGLQESASNKPKDVALPFKLSATAYNMITVYGQSLSVGVRAQAILSITQPFSNVTFSSGVLQH
jgi:hypothetical protein